MTDLTERDQMGVQQAVSSERVARARAVQDREELRTRHVVLLDEDGWALAHTDAERARAERGGRALDECPIQAWLTENAFGLSVKPGPGSYLVRLAPGGECALQRLSD